MTTIEIMCAAILALGIGGEKKWGEYACAQLSDIYTAAEVNEIDPALIVSVIHHESRFRPHVVSKANACGLMQVVPRWTGSKKTGVPKLTCKQLKDPKVNIRYGTLTLKFWIEKYGKKSTKAGLCGYNAGYRCKGTTPHPSGMRYARKVLRTARKIKQKIRSLNSSR